MHSPVERIKCAEYFLTRETLFLECRCAFCHEWFKQHDAFAAHIPTCASNWICMATTTSKTEDTSLLMEQERISEDDADTDDWVSDVKNELLDKDDYKPIHDPLTLKIITQEPTVNVATSPAAVVVKSVATRRTRSVPKTTRKRVVPSAHKANEDYSLAIALRDAAGKLVRLQCDHCGAQLKSRIRMGQHMEREHSNQQLRCDKCGDTFSRHSDWRTHMKRYTLDPFTCEFCGSTFKSKSNLEEHIRIHTGEQPFQCKECGRRFTHSSSLKSHVTVVHQGHRPHKCTVCAVAFATPSKLVRHTNVTHLHIAPEKRHKCDTCHMTFESLCYLRTHLLCHTGERPFACEFCDRRFGRASALKVHENIHTGRTPFKCSQCERTFHSGAARRFHEKGVHKMK